jgi:hypothetical protein
MIQSERLVPDGEGGMKAGGISSRRARWLDVKTELATFSVGMLFIC